VDPVKIGTELCEERQREISVYNSFSENNWNLDLLFDYEYKKTVNPQLPTECIL
jgi:hypothetical protein